MTYGAVLVMWKAKTNNHWKNVKIRKKYVHKLQEFTEAEKSYFTNHLYFVNCKYQKLRKSQAFYVFYCAI